MFEEVVNAEFDDREGADFRRLLTNLSLLDFLFKEIFSNEESVFSSETIKEMLKSVDDMLKTLDSRPEDIVKILANKGVLAAERRGRKIYYRPSCRVAYLMPLQERTRFGQVLRLSLGEGAKFVDRDQQRREDGETAFKRAPLPEAGARILVDIYKTCSAIILQEYTSLEINRRSCVIKKRAELYQLKSEQEIPLPWLYVDENEGLRGFKLTIGGKRLEDLKDLGVSYNVDDNPVEERQGLKLNMGIVRLTNVPTSSLYTISMEGRGKLPVCWSNGEKLVTCIPIVLTYKTRIEIKVDGLELAKSCYIMKVKNGNGDQSPCAVKYNEYTKLIPVKRDFVVRRDGEGYIYELEIPYESHGDGIDPSLFKSIRSSGGVLQIHIIPKGDVDSLVVLGKEDGICGFKKQCKS